jgi:hypothetical protein
MLAAPNILEEIGIGAALQTAEAAKVYRSAAARLHPDRNHAPRAVEAFQRLANAYDEWSAAPMATAAPAAAQHNGRRSTDGMARRRRANNSRRTRRRQQTEEEIGTAGH